MPASPIALTRALLACALCVVVAWSRPALAAQSSKEQRREIQARLEDESREIPDDNAGAGAPAAKPGEDQGDAHSQGTDGDEQRDLPPPVVGEAPAAALLPLSAVSLGAAGLLIARRRRRVAQSG